MRLPTFILLAALPAMTSAQQPGPARVFRAGAATSNITPPVGASIIGGFAPFPSEYIHDELHSRCLALDDGQTRLVFAVNDNLGIAREVYDKAKRSIHEKTGVPVENILMSSTHTHSAVRAAYASPYGLGEPPDGYPDFVASRISDCVLNAIHNMEPARVGWGAGREPGQVFNRRWKLKPGATAVNPFGERETVQMNPGGNPDRLEPAGPTDPEISFLSVQSVSGRPIAVLANYSLHYVGGVGPGHISADYYGMFAGRIGELLGAGGQDPPFVGIMSNGTSGNINNNDYSPGRAAPARRYRPYEKMRMVADVVAAEVYRALRTTAHQDYVRLGAVQREIPMGVRVPTAAQVAWAKSVLGKPAGAPKAHPREGAYAERVLKLASHPPELPYLLQAVRVGDLGIAAIPNEVFVEIGLELKKRSPFPRTFTVSLANGYHMYLPTPEHHKLGGYETWLGTNMLEVEASTKAVRNLLEMFNELK